jgi:hypothetical protein
MHASKITRRDFLKMVGGFLLGVFSWRFLKIFDKASSQTKKTLKEARYYSVADDLAG